MSSLRVRTKNKLMTVLGAAKPSTNVAFDLAYSDFKVTLQRLETLDSALNTYAASIKTFHGVASLVVNAIDGLSSGGSGTASYQQKPVEISEMQQFAGDARVACSDVDMLVLQETCRRLEQEVLIPVKDWLQHACSLQNEAKTFQEQKALYDHYLRKVVALREAHRKRTSMGRSEKSKDTERMFRNEQKLAATTQEYVWQSDAVIRDLRAFVVSRDAALAPLLYRVLRCRAIYAERMHEATGRINALIEDGVEKDDKEGGEDGLLDQYMAVAQGRGPVESTAIMAAATSPLPAYCTVRKSSFDVVVPHDITHKSTTVSPPGNKKHMSLPANGRYGFSEPLNTSRPKTPTFMTAKMSTNAAAGDKFSTSVFSRMSATGSSPVSSVTKTSSLLLSPSTSNYWDAYTTASAPSANLCTFTESSSSQHASWPVANFQDMHRNALRGEISFFH